jgi:hypothetical protein
MPLIYLFCLLSEKIQPKNPYSWPGQELANHNLPWPQAPGGRIRLLQEANPKKCKKIIGGDPSGLFSSEKTRLYAVRVEWYWVTDRALLDAGVRLITPGP